MKGILFRHSLLFSLPSKSFVLLSFVFLSIFSFSSSAYLLHYSDSSPNFSLPEASNSFSTTSLNVSSPVGLSLNFKTFLGSNSIGSSIAVDAQGDSYITGITWSTNFPTKNVFQPVYGGGTYDTFVAKFNSSGNLLFSTFLGGTGDDRGSAIAVDAQGDSYITGSTGSSNFPTKNAFNDTYGGNGDVFVAKFDSNGTLLFSTFFGGTGGDGVSAIAVDAQGDSYITGNTQSSNFPTKNAFNSTYGGLNSVFITKFDSTGNLVFSTFFGGTGIDFSTKIAVDAQGDSYITGNTQSSDFPTKNAFQPIYGRGGDAFVAKFDPTGNLVFSTFLGGSSFDWGYNIAADIQGDSYITGFTSSSNLFTKNAFNATYSGGYDDVFIAKFDSKGNLVFSTFLGSTGADIGTGIAVDSQGNSYVTGSTGSRNFPTKNAYNATYAGSGSVFVAKFNATGNLLFSTFLGIHDAADDYGISVDAQGNSYITGTGGDYVFITKFNLVPIFGSGSSTRFSLSFNSNFFNDYTFLSFCVLGIVVLVVMYTVDEYRKYLSGKTNLSVQNKGSFKQFLIKVFSIKLKHKHNDTNQLSDDTFKLLDEIEEENASDK